MIQIASSSGNNQRKRNLELALLVGVSILGMGGLLLTQMGALNQLRPAELWLVGAVLAVGYMFHGALRWLAPKADPLLLPVALLLNCLGLIEIYRIDLSEGDSGWGASSTRQAVWSLVALVVAFVVITLVRSHRTLQRYTYLSGLLAIVLIVLPLTPGLGATISGARVWINLGSLSFQPGEIAKIALAVFFAGYLYTHREALALSRRQLLRVPLPTWRSLGPLLLFWLIAMAVIVVQRDLGTGTLYFGLFLVMVYVATGRTSWVLFGVFLLVGGAIVAGMLLSYVGARFEIWLNPFSPTHYNREFGGSYQLVQGIFGMAFGGLLGAGLGRGFPQLTPLAQSDYIVASIAEELGLAGLILILLMYLIIFARGMRIALNASDDFSRLLATGLVFVFALQVFIVAGGITRVIPLTGLTAPFLAAGGSSLLANYIVVALLLRLSGEMRGNKPLLISTSATKAGRK